MNNKAVKFFKNFSYTIASNLIALFVSSLVVLIVPKLIGIEEYGYWQLYLFYSSYVGFLHFGWNDGIYLRYGGKEYNELNKKLLFSQFYMLILQQLIIAIIIFFSCSIFISDDSKVFVLNMTAMCMLVVNVRYMLLYILQSTNRIIEYSKITIIDRLLYCCLIVLLLVIGIRDYKLMIVSDIVGKLLSLFFAMYICRDIVFRKISTFYFSFSETKSNIRVGIKLMFANIASILIIGVVRFGIEYTWDVQTFGKVSLTLSISNLMIIFINAVGIIMFPILRRTDKNRLPKIYMTMRDFLMVILFCALMLYFPLKEFLLVWLPKYQDSLVYMALLFPMCIYEGKMALLVNTYLKTLREEKLMLKVNIVALLVSIIITFVNTVFIKNLDFAIVSIVIILAFRCALSEILLSRKLKISIFKDILLEFVMTLVFILVGWFINSWFGIVFYIIAYLIYLFIKKEDIFNTFNNIKVLVRK